MEPVRIAIVGAGNRGRGYSDYCLQHPDAGRVVAVAEPRAEFRERIVRDWDLPESRVFSDWAALAEEPCLADAVIIATPDGMHVAPGLAFSDLGYAVLMEKPVSSDFDECRELVATMERNGTIFAVCHVLRYTPYTRLLKRVLDEERWIGRVIGIQHLEPVGFWHQAHSFVRGNWRNTAMSSPMLLGKSCHDLDWLSYLVGSRCEAVTSFGELLHFRSENAPAGAAERCVDCAVERDCPYSAIRIYVDRVRSGETGWPVNVLVEAPDEASVWAAIRTGPYGRCVYACDNDVVDHQVVSLRFTTGATATFTMSGFTEMRPRETRIFGTAGEGWCDGRRVEVYSFQTGVRSVLEVEAHDGAISSGHGGGDAGVMAAFLDAVRRRDPSGLLSGGRATLESHTMVYAAELARLEDRVVRLAEFPGIR